MIDVDALNPISGRNPAVRDRVPFYSERGEAPGGGIVAKVINGSAEDTFDRFYGAQSRLADIAVQSADAMSTAASALQIEEFAIGRTCSAYGVEACAALFPTFDGDRWNAEHFLSRHAELYERLSRELVERFQRIRNACSAASNRCASLTREYVDALGSAVTSAAPKGKEHPAAVKTA